MVTIFGRKIELKTREEQRLMDHAGTVLAHALDTTVAAVQPGMSTAELDEIFAAEIARAGCSSNFYGYEGFPATICTSINEEAVHGIPRKDVLLHEGDVLKIDAGCIYQGWHSDSARTVLVGDQHDAADQRLSDVTREALWAGIAAAATGKYIHDIGSAVAESIAAAGEPEIAILAEYAGHGIGSQMHMPPEVLNVGDRSFPAVKLRPGMCLCIEPITSRGSAETEVLDDEWTVVTVDGSRACQWEHAIAIHEDGIWVMTAHDGGAAELARYGVSPVPL